MNQAALLHGDHEFTSLVQALIDHTSSVIYVKDTDFRYLLINRQFEQLFHLSQGEILGHTDFDLFPLKLAEGFRANDLHVLKSGEALQCEEIAPQDDGNHGYLSVKFPLRNAQGTIYAIAGISTDISDRIRAQHEIAALQYHQQLILDSVGDGICGLDATGRVVFLNPAAERMLQWTTADLQGNCHSRIVVKKPAHLPLDGSVEHDAVMAVLAGQSATTVQGALFRRRDGSHLSVEFTVAPIHLGPTTVGAVVAFRDTTDRLKHVEIEQEIQTARRIQISLNPKQVPTVPGYDFAAISVPCSKACGDYYDFIPWGKNRLGIAVGDVSGHGLGAALEMVETRAILRTTMLSESDPVQCLIRLNDILTDDLPDDMFVTLFLANLNTLDRTLTYAAAGHEGILLSATGEIRRLESTGTVLGWTHATSFASGGTLPLNSGDLVLLATDGITETVSPARHLFGRDRIIDLLRRYRSHPASDILGAIRTAIDLFREQEPQRDDVTAVVIKVL